MKIRKLLPGEKAPMELLFLADPSKASVEEYLENGECYIGERETEVVGVYVLLAKTPDDVELMNIAVSEDFQGCGYGKLLVMDAIEKARQGMFKTIEVGTGNSSIGPLTLYQKCGFRMVRVDRDFFTKNYSESIYENGIQCRDMIRLSLEL